MMKVRRHVVVKWRVIADGKRKQRREEKRGGKEDDDSHVEGIDIDVLDFGCDDVAMVLRHQGQCLLPVLEPTVDGKSTDLRGMRVISVSERRSCVSESPVTFTRGSNNLTLAQGDSGPAASRQISLTPRRWAGYAIMRPSCPPPTTPTVFFPMSISESFASSQSFSHT